MSHPVAYLDRALARPLEALAEEYWTDGRNRVDRWTRARLDAYARDALAAVLAHAAAASPFYRARFARAGVDVTRLEFPRELARVPVLGREELGGDPWALLAVPRREVAQVNVSTGTTGGDEVCIPSSWDDLHIGNLGPAMRRLVPIGPGDVVVVALPYEMTSAGLAFHRTFQRACGALVVPAGKGGYYSTPLRTLTMARDLGATALVTTPSHAIVLAEAAVALGIELPALPLRRLWLTGEGCSPALRRRIERAWGRPAAAYYGSLEAGPIGIECAARAGFHVAAGHVHLEVLDPGTGEGLAPGETGDIVVTELTRRAAPVIRWRTGDLGFLDDGPCACGVQLPRLHLRGREGDRLEIGGTTCSAFLLEDALLGLEDVGDWYELVPRARGLLVRVEPARGVGDAERLAWAVAARLEYVAGAAVEVELAPIARPRGKAVRVLREASCPI